MSSNLIQPTKPRQKENTHKTSCSRKCPSAISSSHYCIPMPTSLSLCRFMWPFLGLAQVRREFSESREIENLPSLSLLLPTPKPPLLTSFLVSFDNYFLPVFSFSFIIAVPSFSLSRVFFLLSSCGDVEEEDESCGFGSGSLPNLRRCGV